MSQDSTRCTDPKQGVKVLSYDLLEGQERDEVDAHLEECETCRGLSDQVFGDEGAFKELEYRAFKLSQRQNVPATAWFARRLQDLWIPFGIAVILVSIVGFWLVTRGPDVEPVQMRLQTFRGATLDTTSTIAMPRLDAGIESIVLQVDRDVTLLVYETGEEALRRLVPGVGGEAPTVKARQVLEVPLPPVKYSQSRILLIVIPSLEPVEADLWDQALLKYFRGSDIDFEQTKRQWPNDVVPTMKWIQ